MVVVQGVLGGLRVTGGFTLSTSSAAMRPSLALAMVHGIFGQLVFAALVALGAFTSRVWRSSAAATASATLRLDRWLAVGLVVVVLTQLVLGAAQRHLDALLIAHIAFGVAIVAPVAFHVGFRAWGIHDEQPPLQRLGLAIAGAVALQIVLGLAAFVGTRAAAAGDLAPGLEVLLTTAHQGFGAILLGLAVTLVCWSFRLLAPARASHPYLSER